MPGILKIELSQNPQELLASMCQHTPYHLIESFGVNTREINEMFIQFREKSQPLPEALLWEGLTDSFFRITVNKALECMINVREKSPHAMRVFTDGQRISHYVKRKNDYWIGIYNSKKNKILHRGKRYTLSEFAMAHVREVDPGRKTEVNGWLHCKCEVGDKWMYVKEYLERE